MMNLQPLLNCNARAELAKRHFLNFVCYTKKDYEVNWHHKLLCYYLDRFVSGEITRLMVFMPPQHGKSQLVSRQLPAYILGKTPDTKIVVASYSSDLSSGFNRDCQRIIDSDEYKDIFPETSLNRTNIVTVSGGFLRNSDIFQVVNHTGFFKSVGVGGALTGTTADIAIIDDPVKDSLEASSPTYQMRNWDWFNDVLLTRIHNNSKILITQTRWDTNDLSGLLIKSMNEGRGDKWTILNLPAIKEDNSNDEDPRKIGEALWESRHSITKLMLVKNQSLRTFMSLYQQNPQPVETGGEIYKEFKGHRNTKDLGGIKYYNPDIPLHISFDFNVNPAMHAVIFQVTGKRATLIKELITRSPANNTKGICNEFKRHFPAHKSGLFIYGDPSGKTQDTRSEKGFNDYTIICNELRDYRPSLRVLNSHPSVKMRCNFINNIFESNCHGIELIFDSSCIKTIEDFQFIKEDSDGSKLKEKAVDLATGIRSEKWGHLSDAVDYFITMCFAKEYSEYQSGTQGKYSMGKTFSKNSY